MATNNPGDDGAAGAQGAVHSPYTTRVEFDRELASNIISLCYEDRENPSRSIEVAIAPDLGSNMFRFRVGEHEILYCEPALLKQKAFTGNFVLWPFPNRIRGKKYSYQGKNYSLEGLKRPAGNDVLVHGLVFDRQWQHEPPVAGQDFASVRTYVEIDAESPFYAGYPFDSRLSLTYVLTKDGVTVNYAVWNKGAHDMPFGFALHPYFSALSGKEDTLVSIPADTVMEADEELLPTGRLLDVRGTMYAMFDLRQPLPLGNLKLDHVYTDLHKGESTIAEYRQQAMRLCISASAEFTHMVIYTPQGSPFFCLENQTCATDAVNLHQQGLKEMAQLLELSPGETCTGFIKYAIEYTTPS